MMVLKIQEALNKLLWTLEKNEWSADTLAMWKTTGQKRTMEFVLHNRNKEMAFHVLEQKLKGVASLLGDYVEDKTFRSGLDCSKTVMQCPLHLILIPVFFIQQCEKDLQNLHQWSVQ